MNQESFRPAPDHPAPRPRPAFLDINRIREAGIDIAKVSRKTNCELNTRLSEKYGMELFLKREDLQEIRSYKMRGAYNKIHTLSPEEKNKGVICASAGNHAQGVARSCRLLEISALLVMPLPTPRQKIRQVEFHGKGYVEILLKGNTFDEAQQEALRMSEDSERTFIHPFDDEKVIQGQATVGLEIAESFRASGKKPDYCIAPIGGGGLISGLLAVFEQLSPETKIIGVEAQGCPSMLRALEHGAPIRLKKIDKFVDGVAVQKVGELPFGLCQNRLERIITVPEGKICSMLLELYNLDAIVAEPAGALALAGLEMIHQEPEFRGKTAAVIISGGNNDVARMAEILERSLLYESLRHYFVVRFPQRAGALKEFVQNILGPRDDIIFFEYIKKNNRETGPAVVGVELKEKADYGPLLERMKTQGFFGGLLNDKPEVLRHLT